MWFNKQFKEIKEYVTNCLQRFNKDITDKLEYHEKHDDQRFNQIQDDLWAIKLRNAARDGKIDLNGKHKRNPTI